MLATEYAQWHGIEKQGENESDAAFQSRVSGALRDAGSIPASAAQAFKTYPKDRQRFVFLNDYSHSA